MSSAPANQQFDSTVLDSLHEAVGDAINNIITIYVDDFPKSIQTMRQSLSQQDYETIGRIAHSLKSSSGNLGASQLVTLSISLEQIIKAGNPEPAKIEIAIKALEDSFKQVQPQLISYIR